MTAVMQLLGWEAEGLRCPDHKVNLCDEFGQPHKISLIQMPNGTGKTTTLNLLRAALAGTGISPSKAWDQKSVRAMRKKDGGRSGRFELRLELNRKPVTIQMLFNFERGAVRYKTTRGSGQENKFNPPPEFRRFMNANFVSFYIFDGELASQLLSSEHTNAEAIVEHLFQINTLQTMQYKVGDYYDFCTRNVTATEDTGLSRRRNRLSALKKWLSTLHSEQTELQKQKQAAKEELLAHQNAHQNAIELEQERAKKKQSAESTVNTLKNSVHKQTRSTLEMMTQPHTLSTTFGEMLFGLKIGLDRVKLPESAAREFFEEIAEEDECICGREIDDEIRQIIRARSSRYLGSENVAALNLIKTAIHDAVGESRTVPVETLNGAIKSLGRIVDDEIEARNELDAILLEASEADPNVKHAQEEMKRLEILIRGFDRELKKFTSRDNDLDDDHTYGIKVIEKRVEKAENDLAEITQTIELRDKRDVLQGILQKVYRTARTSLTADICKEANQRIRVLMPFNNIEIEKIDKCLILKNQSGGSEGEQLTVAYAFLSTLFNRSDQQLPFVVDSPVGKIDLDIRQEIGKLVPQLMNQFVAFTISAERPAFTQVLEQHSPTPVQHITLFRKGAIDVEQKTRQILGFQETADGYCVPGKPFFDEFQWPKETEG
ncbi:MAG: hypothetical protein ACPG8W_07640 [Candidatus Promineifilaceae bacterium]